MFLKVFPGLSYMIQSSFIFLERVGGVKEKKLWEQGVRNWDDFLRAESFRGMPRHRKLYYDRKITEARKRLYSFDSSYFAKALPESEHWRLYEFFREDC